MASDLTVLEIKDLKTHFFTRDGIVRAVDGVARLEGHDPPPAAGGKHPPGLGRLMAQLGELDHRARLGAAADGAGGEEGCALHGHGVTEPAPEEAAATSTTAESISKAGMRTPNMSIIGLSSRLTWAVVPSPRTIASQAW